MEEERDLVELTDPTAIRAIAHPARLIVIDALYDLGRPLTATQAAELAGTTPSAMSYHLRSLEKFGIVKRASGDDGRERPWIRAAKDIAIRPTASSHSKAAAAAAGAVLAAAMDHDRERLMGAMRRLASKEDRVPLDNFASFTHTSLAVTPDEARSVLNEVLELIKPYRVEVRADPPPEAGRLAFSFTTIPDPDHPGRAESDTERT